MNAGGQLLYSVLLLAHRNSRWQLAEVSSQHIANMIAENYIKRRFGGDI
jgi:hypothetical protein